MRILFISSLYFPDVLGGAETYLARLVDALSHEGHTIEVFATGREDVTEELNGATINRRRARNIFPLIEFPQRPAWQRLVWRAGSYVFPRNLLSHLEELIARFKPDVICTQNVLGFPLGLFELLRKAGIPLIHTIHDYFLLCPRLSLLHRNGDLCVIKGAEAPDARPAGSICHQYRREIQRHLEGLFSAIVAPSRFILDAHRAEGLFSDTDGFVIPLGSTFSVRPLRPPRLPGPIRLLSVGAMSGHKGGELILKLPKLLAGDAYRFDIAGSGELESAWRDIAAVDSRVRFHGFISGHLKEKLFSEADVFLLPSIWYDNSPVVIYESFSFGLPVLASRIGGIPELVVDGKNGILISPGDLDALTSSVEKIRKNPEVLEDMSRNAYQSSKELTFEKHVAGFLQQLGEAIKSK